MEERRARSKTMGSHLEALEDNGDYDSIVNFSMGELFMSSNKCGKTTPGEANISYCMLKNLSERGKSVLLKMYNRV